MVDDEPAQPRGELTPEDRRTISRYLTWTLGIEITLVLLAGWYGGVTWALILAAILMVGVGYGLIGMRKELIRRRQLPPDA